MRAVIQRVERAQVTVDGEVVGAIGPGLLLLVGVARGDGPGDVSAIASKVAGLRVFRDDEGRMNLSVSEVGGSVLVVSQFTLYGDVRRGRRPSFVEAADPVGAEALVDGVVGELRASGLAVETGRFGAMMAVALVNDGPVTILLETRDGRVV